MKKSKELLKFVRLLGYSKSTSYTVPSTKRKLYILLGSVAIIAYALFSIWLLEYNDNGGIAIAFFINIIPLIQVYSRLAEIDLSILEQEHAYIKSVDDEAPDNLFDELSSSKTSYITVFTPYYKRMLVIRIVCLVIIVMSIPFMFYKGNTNDLIIVYAKATTYIWFLLVMFDGCLEQYLTYTQAEYTNDL